MGVDYNANFGIGVQVIRKDFDEDSEYYEDFLGWIDEQLEGSEYSYFETGSSMYGGEENDVYVVLDEPFSEGLDLTKKAEDLKSFLQSKEIEYEGEVDIVGGLLID